MDMRAKGEALEKARMPSHESDHTDQSGLSYQERALPRSAHLQKMIDVRKQQF